VESSVDFIALRHVWSGGEIGVSEPPGKLLTYGWSVCQWKAAGSCASPLYSISFPFQPAMPGYSVPRWTLTRVWLSEAKVFGAFQWGWRCEAKMRNLLLPEGWCEVSSLSFHRFCSWWLLDRVADWRTDRIDRWLKWLSPGSGAYCLRVE